MEVIFNNKIKNLSRERIDELGYRAGYVQELASLSLPVSPFFILDGEIFKNCSEDKLKIILQDSIKTLGSLVGNSDSFTVKAVLSPNVNLPFRSIHNIGLSSSNIDIFSKECGEDFAYQEYYDLIVGYYKKVLGKDLESNAKVQEYRKDKSIKELCNYLLDKHAVEFPQNISDQLFQIIMAYRNEYYSNKLNSDIPCSVLIEVMVYGNYGDESYSGYFTTRNPVTGERNICGNFSKNAFDLYEHVQKAGIDELGKEYYEQLERIARSIEKKYFEIRKVKFAIQEGRLWVIDQFTETNRSARALMQLMLELHQEKVIDDKYVIERLSFVDFSSLFYPELNMESVKDLKAIPGGVAGSNGSTVGKVCFGSKRLVEAYHGARAKKENENFILVMKSTYAEDVQAIELGTGVISSEGGYASHAPVVARSLGKVAVINDDFDIGENSLRYKGIEIKDGDYVSLHVPTFASPSIFIGKANFDVPKDLGEVKKIIRIISDYIKKQEKINKREFAIRSNADSAKDAKVARGFGARGIGLCRTEHMFFESKRINHFRAMLIASTLDERVNALEKLKEYQKSDFLELFEFMDGEPVNIRLLDAPLHEFVPKGESDLDNVLSVVQESVKNIDKEKLLAKFGRLGESNPMIGHRGCRFAISYPEVYEMQVSAILEASYEIFTQKNINSNLEIMLPMIMSAEEVKFLIAGRNIEGIIIPGIKGVHKKVLEKYGISDLPFKYKLGTMIELPAAALLAKDLSQYCSYFSFGTNDLTQTTHGLSRDDINSFYPSYTQYDIIDDNPFIALSDPVKQLIEYATKMGRVTRPDLKVGLCGEHGADIKNFEFCYKAGLDYVSCSPYNIPMVKLAYAKFLIGSN